MVKTIIAGETLAFTESHVDYKASAGWLLTIYLRGVGQIDIPSTADGDDFLIEIPFSVTSTWKAGTYRYETYVSDGTERYRIDYGDVTIETGLTEILSEYDIRSDVKKTLDAINATLLGRATSDQLNYTVAGRRLEKIPIADLIQLKGIYETEYQRELDAEALDKGLASGRKVRVRFVG